AEGAPGTAATPIAGRWGAKGGAHPYDATLAGERAPSEASAFGAVGLLQGLVGHDDGDAPAVPWGREADGPDVTNAAGRLFGYSIGDASGTGGLGLHGVGEGGGGKAAAIGLNGIGILGHGGGRIDGGRFGDCTCDGSTSVNGRLPPEAIQRVIRQNFGRMRLCYETGLRADPGLAGRVQVRFVI